MALILIILLPLLFAPLPMLFRSRGVTWCAVLSAIAPVCGLALLFQSAGAVMQGEPLVVAWPWIPQLGLSVTLRLDALGVLFAGLIMGMGLLIILYARHYFAGKPYAARFFTLMLLFMTAMLGIVLSENLLFMLIFWEMTSLVSFLLIGFYGEKRASRRGARLSLVITGGGGLALMAGIVLLGQVVGSYNLSEVLAAGDQIRADARYPVILTLILLGAFTKSAQFPFHLWLPHAMSAPTPVSAYLHSATMVKAGIFLMMRLHPALAGTEAWFYMVTTTGVVTLLVGAFVAMFMHDIKGLLAYSTISHLGLITALLGLGTTTAVVVALFHLLNHAMFKAPLFMAAGIVDQATGTRDMRRINGMWRYMPLLGVLTFIPAAAMAGLPLLNGYYSKKMFFIESLANPVVGPAHWLLPVLVTLAGLFSVAYSARIFHNVFFNGQPVDLPKPNPKPPGWSACLPLIVLASLCLVVGFIPSWLVLGLVQDAAVAALQQPLIPYDMASISQGALPWLMSIIAVLGGLAFYAARHPLFAIHDRLPPVDAKENFEWLMQRVIRFSQAFVHQLENDSLQRYAALVVLTALALGAIPLLGFEYWQGDRPMMAIDPISAGGAALLMLLSLSITLVHRKRLVALLFLGAIGLFVTLGFGRFSAPDLALTQLSVEVMAVVIMMLALSFLPQSSPRESSLPRSIRDFVLAASAGSGVMMLTYAILTRPHTTISDYFLANSVSGGGGTNVVNVILVDFRGFDTLGEITVLAIAGIAVFALTRNLKLKARVASDQGFHWVSEPHPLILSTIARPVLPIALLVSAYIFLRGHNMPGGGFIAGLITSVALGLQYIAGGLTWAHSRMLTKYRPLIGAGLLLAIFTGMGSLVFGAPFLTSWFDHFHLPLIGEFEFATVLLFDLGVFAVVVGATLLILADMGRLMTVDGTGKEIN